MDLSPLRKWEVLGPDAETLIQRAITRDARRLSVGQVTYTAVCNETGGMIDDATVYRLGQDNFRFVGGDEYDGIWLKELADRHALKVWVKPSTDQLHNVAVQGPESQAAPEEDRVDAADADLARGPALVPLHGRANRDVRRHPDRRLAHRLHGRARVRGLVPSHRRACGLGRDLGGGTGARPDAARARGARHPPDRERLDLRRVRVRRPGRPVRGGHRVHGRSRDGRGLRRPRRARGAEGAPAARSRRPRARGERDRRPRRRGVRGRQRVGVVTSGTRSPILKKNVALARVAVQYADLGTTLEVGKLDGLQKRIPRPSSASRSTTPRRTARAPDRVVHFRAGRCVPARRLPDRGGRPDPRERARAAARALSAPVRW